MQKNVPVKMSDGTVLRANVYFPTDAKTGAAASGPFPVIMVYTPYGKDIVGKASGNEGGAEAGTQAGQLPYFVKRGYIFVAAAVRGTGTSGGQADWFGTRTGKDGAAVVRWAAQTLDGSNGTIGLDGCSYLGVNQWSRDLILPRAGR